MLNGTRESTEMIPVFPFVDHPPQHGDNAEVDSRTCLNSINLYAHQVSIIWTMLPINVSKLFHHPLFHALLISYLPPEGNFRHTGYCINTVRYICVCVWESSHCVYY